MVGGVLDSFTQRAMVCGLFIGLWGSVVRSNRYAELEMQRNLGSRVVFTDELNGRIAHWRTRIEPPLRVSWKLHFHEKRLGSWQCAITNRGFTMWWISPIGEAEARPVFDEQTFAWMYGTLQHACTSYIRYYGFSANQENPLVDFLLDTP